MREHRELQTLIDQLNAHTREQDEAIKALQKTNKYLVAQLKKAILEERERCAVLVERFEPEYFYLGQVKRAANLIRTRSER